MQIKSGLVFIYRTAVDFCIYRICFIQTKAPVYFLCQYNFCSKEYKKFCFKEYDYLSFQKYMEISNKKL